MLAPYKALTRDSKASLPSLHIFMLFWKSATTLQTHFGALKPQPKAERCIFSVLDSAGGRTAPRQPRFLLPGLRTGPLPAEQGWNGCRSRRLHPVAPGGRVRQRCASQALCGPGQAHRHHIQSGFPAQLPHLQRLLLGHLQSAAARGHPRKLVKLRTKTASQTWINLSVGTSRVLLWISARNFVLRCVFGISAWLQAGLLSTRWSDWSTETVSHWFCLGETHWLEFEHYASLNECFLKMSF